MEYYSSSEEIRLQIKGRQAPTGWTVWKNWRPMQTSNYLAWSKTWELSGVLSNVKTADNEDFTAYQ